MKKHLLLYVLCIWVINTQAQNSIAYEGAIEISKPLQVFEHGYNYLAIETLQGIRYTPDKQAQIFGHLVVGYRYRQLNQTVESMSLSNLSLVQNKMNYISYGLDLGVRFTNIRKLRKKFIPAIHLRFMDMWCSQGSTHTLYIRDIENVGDIEKEYTFYNNLYLEFGFGGEFIIAQFPRIYMLLSLNWGGAKIREELKGTITQKENNDTQDIDYKVRIENPLNLNLKIGIRF